MTKEDAIKKKLALTLLKQRDEKNLKKQKILYLLLLLVTFGLHLFFSNLETPLKLIPQTMCALYMGFLIYVLSTIGQFRYVKEFILWDKVEEEATD